ncbi:MAG: MCE family protein [Chitinivibrionales bacterium]|nr:MCE family protein [Chitinivibrionales bacterium]
MQQSTTNLFNRKKELAWASLKAGIIITTGAGILFVAIFFSGATSTLFVPQESHFVHFENVGGLRTGSPVWLLGVEIGTVGEIRFSDTATVVTLSVNRASLDYIHADAEASIQNMGILGDKYVEIDPGTKRFVTVVKKQTIRGKTAPAFDDIMHTSARSITEVRSFVARIDSIVKHVEQGEGSLSKLIKSQEFYQAVYSSINSLSIILQDIRRADGSLRRAIEDPSLYKEVLAATGSIKRFSTVLNDSTGPVQKILGDPELYAKIKTSLGHLENITARLESGHGILGSLSRSDTLARNLENTLKNMDALLKDIRNNPEKYFEFSIF